MRFADYLGTALFFFHQIFDGSRRGAIRKEKKKNVSRALSNLKRGLFHPRCFKNGISGAKISEAGPSVERLS